MLIHKLYPNVIRPERQTELSACFDIHAHLRGPVISEDKTPEFRKVRMIDRMNHSTEIMPEAVWHSDTPHTTMVIPPHSRALIPTGMIFDIESDYSIRIHPRSGLSWKHGITLINCEGVIDSDYTVEHGDRIAQFEIIRYNDTITYLTTTEAKAKKKADRVGGFGSTGV